MILALLACVRFVGLDLGSQFMKWAESLPDGQVVIRRDPISNSVTVPSAAALRFRAPHDLPLTEKKFEDIEMRYGTQALTTLKGNSSVGFEFAPRVVARSRESPFYTCDVANITEVFALMLQHAIVQMMPFDAISISVPSYATRDQIIAVSEVCRVFQIPLVSVVDDCMAVCTLYATQRLGRFMAQPKHVLFVDVGATSVKAYAAAFLYAKEENEEMAIANMTANEWTENVGGYYFAKAIADSKGIPVRKGQKLLLRNNGEGYEDLFVPLLHELGSLVRTAKERAEEFGPIDEVQLIGGASTFTFVVDTIRAATNHSIRRDFNSNEAVAMGAVVSAMLHEDSSPYIPTTVVKTAPSTVNLVCGEKVKPYCQKGGRCADVIVFEDMNEVSELLAFFTEDQDLPESTDKIQVTYSLTAKPNITEGENVTMKVYMRNLYTVIDHVEVCQNGSCEAVGTYIITPAPAEYNTGLAFVNNFINSRANKETRTTIKDLLERLNAHLEKLSKANVEATYPATDEMKEIVKAANEAAASEDFENFDSVKLGELKEKLERVRDGLHLSH